MEGTERKRERGVMDNGVEREIGIHVKEKELEKSGRVKERGGGRKGGRDGRWVRNMSTNIEGCISQ